jgi:FMN phosphatase YigB (HAD superfamily)
LLDIIKKLFMTVEYLISQNKKRRQLVFDLDNTIYEETQFLFKVYKEISKTAINNEPDIIYKFLKKKFIEEGRKDLFNKLKKKFPSESFTVENCLSIMKNFKCNSCINTFPWFKKFLSQMKSDFIIKIITNGTLQQQQNKIKSINFNWPKELIEVIYASSIEAKPEILSFYKLKDVENFISPIYVGDSSEDEQFCKKLNIEFYDSKKLRV